MTPLELSSITAAPTLVMAGDDDAITLEHTVALYRGLPNSELAVVPGTSHLLVLEKPTLCDTRFVVGFQSFEVQGHRIWAEEDLRKKVTEA